MSVQELNTRLDYLKDNLTDRWAVLGYYFGFPPCCTDDFIKSWGMQTKMVYPDGLWVGTGFIPCIDCAEQCMVNFNRFIKTRVKPYRICQIRFPDGDNGPVEDEVVTRSIRSYVYSFRRKYHFVKRRRHKAIMRLNRHGRK